MMQKCEVKTLKNSYQVLWGPGRMPRLILTVRDSFEFEHSSLWVTRGCKCIKTKIMNHHCTAL